MNTHKVCTRCKKRKPVTAFNKRAKARDGFRHTCKECDGEIRKNWEAGQREEQSAPEAPAVSAGLPKALPPGSGGPPRELVEAGGLAPASSPPKRPDPAPEPGGKVIGRIGSTLPTGTQIREVVSDPAGEAEKALARDYAQLLNKKLPIRRRANLMIKIAKNAEGPTAALALAALRDINNATGVTSRQGAAIDLGPLFVMPEGTGKMKMSGG